MMAHYTGSIGPGVQELHAGGRGGLHNQSYSSILLVLLPLPLLLLVLVLVIVLVIVIVIES
jgi:hypothetical protein